MNYVRYGRVLKLKKEFENEYKEYHKKVWPEIEEAIKNAGIRNYSIFLNGEYLFAYFELCSDSTLDKMGESWMKNPACIRWEEIMNKMQEPVEDKKPGEWWAQMEEIFHQD